MGVKTLDITPAMWDRMPAAVKSTIQRTRAELDAVTKLLKDTWSVLGPRTYVQGKLTDPRHERGIIVNPNGQFPLAIHEDFGIRLWLEEHKTYVDVQIIRRGTQTYLQIMGDRSVSVHPMSGNVVLIKGNDW